MRVVILELFRSFDGKGGGATRIRVDDAGRWSVASYDGQKNSLACEAPPSGAKQALGGTLDEASRAKMREAVAKAAKKAKRNGWIEPEHGGG